MLPSKRNNCEAYSFHTGLCDFNHWSSSNTLQGTQQCTQKGVDEHEGTVGGRLQWLDTYVHKAESILLAKRRIL